MTATEEIFLFFGRSICHQLPERSFMVDGRYLPFCARDTGIYIGIFSSLVFLYFSKKYRATMIPNIKVSLCLLMMLMPLAVDGLGSYLHFYETNNVNRMVTGILFGTALPFFLIPLLHQPDANEAEVRVITKFGEIIYPLAFAATIWAFIYYSFLPFVMVGAALISASVCWFALIFLALFKKIIRNSQQTIFLSWCSSFVILTLLSVINKWIRSLSLINGQ